MSKLSSMQFYEVYTDLYKSIVISCIQMSMQCLKEKYLTSRKPGSWDSESVTSTAGLLTCMEGTDTLTSFPGGGSLRVS